MNEAAPPPNVHDPGPGAGGDRDPRAAGDALDPAPGVRSTPFALLRHFAVVSMISIALATLIITTVDYSLEFDEHVEIGELKNTTLAEAFSNAMWPHFAPLLGDEDLHAADRAAILDKLEFEVPLQIAHTGILKVRIFDRRGTIVYSTAEAEIGEDRSGTDGLVRALRGTILSSTQPAERGVDGKRIGPDLVETYLPLRSIGGGEGNIVGVIELYGDNSDNLARRRKDSAITAAVVVLTMLVLYGLLFFIVRRADSLIREQNAERARYLAELRVAKQNLEDRVAERTAQLTEVNQALIESEDRFRSIATCARDAIVVLERDGSIAYWNPAGTRLFGFESDEILGRDVDQLFEGRAARERLSAQVSKYAGRDPTADPGLVLELDARRKDGSAFEVEVSLSGLKTRTEDVTLCVIRDVSERRQAERRRHELEVQLRQAQKMEAIGRLTGGIAHDFNNVLGAILGFTTLALHESRGARNERLVGYLEEVSNAAGSGRDVVQQMLAFSRRRPNRRVPTSVPEAVRRTLKMLTSTLPSSIEIRTDVDDDCPSVIIESSQLEQVVMNLCINARDAMEGVGTIDVQVGMARHHAVKCQSCHAGVSGEFVELEVRDNGSGIGEELLSQIFDPFFTTKAVGKGSGMGLSMVHGIVHEHRGHILIHTAPGEGTAVRLLFPPHDEAAPATQLPRADDPVREPSTIEGRIMVVDDDPSMARFLGELVSKAGCDTQVFTSSEDALRAFRKEPDHTDLVIADQTMPGLTGIELARAMQGVRAGLPVILCTGYRDGILDRHLSGSGIRKVLDKPVQVDELLDHVRTLLNARVRV